MNEALSWEQLKELATFEDDVAMRPRHCSRHGCAALAETSYGRGIRLCPSCAEEWRTLAKPQSLTFFATQPKRPATPSAEHLGGNVVIGAGTASRFPTQTQDKQDTMAIPEQNPTRTIASRLTGAMKEGAKRAPVELALEEGQKMVVAELLRGFKGSRAEKAGARKFLLWFFTSPAGQVAIAGAISGGAPLVAGLIGKDGPVVQTVADEFAARAATITTKEGMKFAARRLAPLLGIFTRLFDSLGGDDERPADVSPKSLDEGRPGCAVFNMAEERERANA